MAIIELPVKKLTAHDNAKSLTPTRQLTPKQESFARWYVELNGRGYEAMLKSDFDIKGETNVANVMAVEYLQKPHIKNRIMELWKQKQEQENTIPLKDTITYELKKIALDMNEQTGNRTRALELLAKIEKMFSDLELKADNVTFNVKLTDTALKHSTQNALQSTIDTQSEPIIVKPTNNA